MKNKFVNILVPLISVLLAFVVGCIVMAVLGAALAGLWFLLVNLRLRRKLRTAELVAEEPDLTVAGETASGEELLELISTQRPDVVVLDLLLTGMDGLEAAQAILEELEAA